MSLEIEAKMRLTDFAPLLKRLQEAGAQSVVRLLETNIFLDRDDLSLRKNDSGLRVRIEHDRDRQSLRAIIITHKGPRLSSALKARPETEMHVQDADDALALLGALGYHETLRFEKRRDRWELENCHIELDTLPLIGSFVEVEGPDEATIQRVRTRLALAALPLETSGYAALLSRELDAKKITSRVVTF